MGVSVDFYGVSIPIWLACGTHHWTYKYGYKSQWSINNAPARITPVTRGQADYSFGWRVPEGATFIIRANAYAKWYWWFFFTLINCGSGWGAEAYCSFTPIP